VRPSSASSQSAGEPQRGAMAGAAGAAPAAQHSTAIEPPEASSDHSSSPLNAISLDQPLRDARDEFERIYFEYHLGRENHSMTRVSERTGLERTHLYRKLKQLGIDASRRRNLASSSS